MRRERSRRKKRLSQLRSSPFEVRATIRLNLQAVQLIIDMMHYLSYECPPYHAFSEHGAAIDKEFGAVYVARSIGRQE